MPQLTVSRRRYQGLEIAARLAQVGPWAIQLAPRCFLPSPEWLSLHDWPADAPPSLGQALRMVPAAHRRHMLQVGRACLAARVPLDVCLPVVTARGRFTWMRFVAEPVVEEGRVVALQGACQDITVQVQREAQAREVADRLALTLESITDGFMCWDRQWRITFINTAAETASGVRRGAVIGRPLAEVFPDFAGSAFHAEYAAAWQRMEPHRFEACVPARQRWLEVRCYPAPDQMSIYFQDVTERRQMQQELEVHRTHLERLVARRTAQLQEVNEELSQFAAAVAHDVRAPLDAVSGFALALQERLRALQDDKVHHYLQRICRAAQRTDTLIRALLDLVRLGRAPLELQDVDLGALAADCVAELRLVHPERRVEVHIAPGLHARADRRLVRTLLENLLSNAFKFTRDRGDARIDVGCEGGAFFVRDNGVGFDPQRMEEVFLPFRRLHEEADYPGTGVGLASARRVAERHGGRLWAQARQGEGAVFYFSLNADAANP